MKAELRNPKVLAGVVLVLVLLAIGLWPKAVPADLAAVERGALRVTIDEEGETRVHDRFVIASPVAGRLLRVDLEPGDRVERASTVLATLKPGAPTPLDARARAEAEARVRAARAALGQARAQQESALAALSLARSEHGRSQELARERIVSAELLEQSQATLRTREEAARAAQYATARAEHELEMAKASLLQASGGDDAGEPMTILSPIDGVVLKRLRWSEAVVPAGEPLLELGDPENLEIVSDMLSTDAVRIHDGDPVLVEQWGGDEVLSGKVRRVEPSGFTKISALGVEEQRVNVVIDLEDPAGAWKRLGDGYRVEVRVVVWEGQDVVKLPTGSLFRHQQGWAAFAVEGGRARLREIEIGRRNGLEAQVLAGLEPGQQVVVHPSDTLQDGSRVTPRS